ncbi:hypothetical protein NDU88_005481 [Pleurodeles waltl]|uniref:Uncharacterized protein n=1 Tax=Pleurodeles waltl TaxID=8319 RepID=A0AAV7WC27_PLEWA|nr:hypothetical protein NDU88_005481 [Pleurodeles waltl]
MEHYSSVILNIEDNLWVKSEAPLQEVFDAIKRAELKVRCVKAVMSEQSEKTGKETETVAKEKVYNKKLVTHKDDKKNKKKPEKP